MKDHSKLALLTLAAFMCLSTLASAQDALSASSNPSAHADGTHELGELSKPFAESALRALTAMRDWRNRISFALQKGYPLSDFLVENDRNRAGDALSLARWDVANSTDQAAFEEMLRHHADLSAWSDALIAAARDMRLAQYYMTPNGLEKDSQYQQLVTCTDMLQPMLSTGRIESGRACQTTLRRF
jgi:hypothetical protein